MIESILIDYLTGVLNVPVYVMLPDELPTGNFIVLDRIGTYKTNHVTTYEMALQSYGDTALDAATLNDAVISAMDDFVVLDSVARSHLETAQMRTDITRKRPRYQCTYEITML